ncbi:MAG: YafY family transcriptional regulator [Trueperaceae bacterium]|nr:YafY family transcriptional regulator [Trueperaceae bacterium]
MNRTDRLLAIVLELQGRDRVTADELARTFEVTKRTIYRDVQALCESGVPVVSAAGQGYWLMEGYFLPPVSLSPDEAIMLILGSDLMAKSFDAQYQQAAQAASRKIEALLQAKVLAEVSYLKNNIRFISLDSEADVGVPEVLQQLRRSIVARKSVRIRYKKRTSNQEDAFSERLIDPHSLLHMSGAWMLSAYCHMRHTMRMFRLSRIKELELTDISFTRQANFDVHKLHGPDNLTTAVELLFDNSIADLVKERPLIYSPSYEDTAQGLKVTLKVRKPEEILGWILSWGSKVNVLQPESLKRQVLAELEAIQKHYLTTIH